jgi:hypothetical protein
MVMRAALVLLVACGGGKATSKPVEQPTTTTPATTTSMTPNQPQPRCASRPRRVVVFEVESAPAATPEAQAISKELTISDPCFELKPASTTLADAKKSVNCGAEHPICMAVIGQQEGADVLVYGRAEKRGATVHVTLRALDVAGRQTIAVTTKPFEASTDVGATTREMLAGILAGP